MTNEIVPFDFEGNEVRIINIEGNPWWVAGDVTQVLGYSNPRTAVSRHVDEEDRNTVPFQDGNNSRGNPNRTILNESGLYALMLASKLPQAKRFKKWVTSEVLPEIRKWGFYNPSMSEEDKQVEAARQYYEATKQWAEAKKQLDIAQPKAARLDLLVEADGGGYTIASVGRALDFTGRLKVFWQHLIDLGALVEDHKSRLIPSDRWLDLEYMGVRGRRTPVITEEGFQHLESLDLK